MGREGIYVMSTTVATTSASPQPSGRERRVFPRVKGPFDGTWTGASGRAAARIGDLSTGGCYIDALNDQRHGEQLSVTIDLPEGAVAALGEIVYSTPNQGFAVKFLTMDDASRDAVHRAVDRLLAAGQGT